MTRIQMEDALAKIAQREQPAGSFDLTHSNSLKLPKKLGIPRNFQDNPVENYRISKEVWAILGTVLGTGNTKEFPR